MLDCYPNYLYETGLTDNSDLPLSEELSLRENTLDFFGLEIWKGEAGWWGAVSEEHLMRFCPHLSRDSTREGPFPTYLDALRSITDKYCPY